MHKKTRAQGKFNLIQDRNCCIILLQNITLHNLPDLIENNIPVCSGEMAWWGLGQSLKQDLKVEGHYYIPYALSSGYSELPGAAPSVGCVPNSWLPTPSTLLPLRSCCSQWVGHSVLSYQGLGKNSKCGTTYNILFSLCLGPLKQPVMMEMDPRASSSGLRLSDCLPLVAAVPLALCVCVVLSRLGVPLPASPLGPSQLGIGSGPIQCLVEVPPQTAPTQSSETGYLL